MTFMNFREAVAAVVGHGGYWAVCGFDSDMVYSHDIGWHTTTDAALLSVLQVG